ncbi:NUDIX hydrolase [Deinococcus radiodurans]|jgi:Isopentenyldiphosphate isomerase|uniref:Nudix hydrolase DR_0079 n=1 Tax=Deinococcus radiodurans (strain ATCC 13939 / DSM 20539 / JCM 16871 / CCUG 27074 / LMG 4051 / NBRC 15346 / NCIMB 9279 / VKM B-1422 / R1) TaxID=243230 RepID=Y079_DEIRA|nr:NUDIX hydrolase [Deinococcus radiodurans]Q9RY71.1 RecName: Full=Nudix hydrolase DR_0079 [Deinococcus radiodurans R1 = ATCC 13939 = DSM 20539]1Q27_A Chain A, Putative Nudix hydrolase DR0079 [Deinococcus radiodurans]2O5F_A Chain A, Putative Nudix hydrolase DR_0079 [Deinococcus radiodurans R1 = ATCC 13939 = DSM 20539]2O5F_B Chain B, Putative Nudix hydrolase DR_0079 [Deinococcus radiodurans R1 = ATCC 13939 = DSM 20539]AAF09672.1 MutT/nudix family protein [Deinococcus radiodurans R1 = ATCC 13939
MGGVSDERLDLVNERDEVVGQILRTDPALRWERVRVVNAFLRNSQGQLWIPRRSPSKSLFPNALDVSVGGAVQSGETYEEAFRREAREELNVEIDALSWRPLASFSPFQTTLSSFMCVYELRSDATPIFNPNDISGGEWLTPEHLLARIAAGEAAKGDLAELVRRCYREEE